MFLRIKIIAITSALLVVAALNVEAQNAGGVSAKDSVRHLQEVDVVTNRINKGVTSVTPTQMLGNEDMQKLGITDFSDAVKRFTGVNVRDYGGIGGMKTVSVRNLGAQHTAVSYDGVTVSNTQAGQIDIGRFSLDNVQMLSLSIGQNDDIMQSARNLASAGILSVETERPYFLCNQPRLFKFKLQGGSFGYVNPSLRYWQKISGNTALSVNGDYMRADGIYPFKLKNGSVTTDEKRYNSDVYAWHGEANLYHTFADSSKMQAKAYYYYSERGLPGAVILYNNVANERLWDENFFSQISYDKRFSPQWSVQTRAKYNHSWNKYTDTGSKYEGGKQTDVNRQDEYYASVTVGWHPLAHLSFAVAQDLIMNTLRTNINERPNPVRFTSLTALSARYSDSRLTANANLVGTFATEHVESGDTPDDRHRLSPSVSLSYRLLSGQSLFARVMVKSTFRVPSFNDLYYLRIGNRGLRPEKATEYNAGLTWGGHIYNVDVSVTADGYIGRVTDKIVAFPSTYVWKMANFGKVNTAGLDVTIGMNRDITADVNVMLTVAYSYQKATDVTDKEAATYKSQLPYTPKNNGNAQLTISNPWLTLGYSVMACGERYSSQMNTEEYSLAPYWEHTLSLSHNFKMRKCDLLLQGTLQNLCNEQYEIVKYYPMPGRNWKLTGTITF